MSQDQSISKSEKGKDLIPFEIIRTETALSRYPIHNLSTKAGVSIEIKKTDASGATNLLWEVSYNNRYGQPGRLAYKLDTIIINRAIEEAVRPIPKMIRLGSIRDICRMLGINEGQATRQVKTALRQNVGAQISAKITYRANDKTERTLEADFHRYSAIFTGETLPDGRKADGVYLLLNELYVEVLNNALTRPLDYDYLQDLTPTEQRFYEIVSYQIFPAVKFNQRARLAYSEYCLYSTQTRYLDYDHVKKQMGKVHRKHINEGYIVTVQFEATTDEQGRPDWNMFYTPGPRAKREQLVFDFALRIPRKPKNSASKQLEPDKKQQIEVSTSSQKLQSQLLLQVTSEAATSGKAESIIRFFYQTFHQAGKTAKPSLKEIGQAEDLLTRLGEEQTRYVVTFAHREAEKTKFDIQTFGGVILYESRAVSEYQVHINKKAGDDARKARQRHEDAHKQVYLDYLWEMLGRLENDPQGTFNAFLDDEKRIYVFHSGRSGKSERSATVISEFYSRQERLQRFIEFIKTHEGLVLSFWQWDESLNQEPFGLNT